MQINLRRLRIDRWAVLLLLFAAVQIPAAAGKGANRPEPFGEPQVYKKVGSRELHVWVVKPADWKAGDQHPAIVFFHGGGWTVSLLSQFNEQCKYFASRGMVCLQVEYRLVSSRQAPDVCIQDARSAMRWARSHARELGIDPQRIASAGGSAGGHLAAFVGMVDGCDDPSDDLKVSPKSNAMLLFNPVFDNGPQGPGNYGYDRIKDRYPQLSPAHNVSSDDPPAIVFFGANDPVAGPAEGFREKMERAKVRCELKLYAGQGHGFFNHGRHFYETTVEADRFLASLGWLQGPPTLDRSAPVARGKGDK
jgi:acetyl esterase/lipase